MTIVRVHLQIGTNVSVEVIARGAAAEQFNELSTNIDAIRLLAKINDAAELVAKLPTAGIVQAGQYIAARDACAEVGLTIEEVEALSTTALIPLSSPAAEEINSPGPRQMLPRSLAHP
jgi:hypothetical protein